MMELHIYSKPLPLRVRKPGTLAQRPPTLTWQKDGRTTEGLAEWLEAGNSILTYDCIGLSSRDGWWWTIRKLLTLLTITIYGFQVSSIFTPSNHRLLLLLLQVWCLCFCCQGCHIDILCASLVEGGSTMPPGAAPVTMRPLAACSAAKWCQMAGAKGLGSVTPDAINITGLFTWFFFWLFLVNFGGEKNLDFAIQHLLLTIWILFLRSCSTTKSMPLCWGNGNLRCHDLLKSIEIWSWK